MAESRIKTLLCYADYAKTLGYFDDWKEAFENEASLDVASANLVDPASAQEVARHALDSDLIVILHSANGDTTAWLRPHLDAFNSRRGRLLSFVGNEVNLPVCGMAEKIDLLRQLEADYIATQLPLDAARQLYSQLPTSEVIDVPHALNPARYQPGPPLSERPIDIGVRSWRYLPLIGDNDRNAIIDFFADTPFNPPLALDIDTSMEGRLNASAWADFLSRCRGTVATEAGSGFLEPDDATMKKICSYLDAKSASVDAKRYAFIRSWARACTPSRFRRYARKLTQHIPHEKAFRASGTYTEDTASFDEIHERFYKGYRNPLSGKCISSRHFDAIGTQTVQIMFPGAFNGILLADSHYIALHRDFSNIDDVLQRFRDVAYCEKMVESTHAYVLASHTHAHRIQRVLQGVGLN